MLYRVTSTPLGCALVRGGLFGAAMGVFDGVRENSLRSGLSFGLITGVVFALFVALEARGRLADLRGLSGPDRETVVRTVRKGSRVEDPRLAPVIAAHAASLRRRCEQTSGGKAFGYLVYGFLASISAIMAVAATQEDNGAGAVGFGLLAAFWAAMLFVNPRVQERTRQRLDRVQTSAQALLAAGGSAD